MMMFHLDDAYRAARGLYLTSKEVMNLLNLFYFNFPGILLSVSVFVVRKLNR